MARREPGRANAGGRRENAWLRLAGVFIPDALRDDPEELRRARTAVLLCAIPVFTSLCYAWNYAHVLTGQTRLVVCAAILGTNLAVLGALLTLRRTGRVGLAINIVLAYSFADFSLLSGLFGGPCSSMAYWLTLLPLVALLTSGTRPALIWLSLCLAVFTLGFALQQGGVVFPNHLPRAERIPLWASSIACISLVCLIAVMVYERAKDATLRTLLAANAQLERARDAAQAADESKADFLARASAEIRTPLTAILGFAEILLRETEKGLLPREHEQTLLTIRRNGENLLDIINDILDLSKIAAGRFDVAVGRFAPMTLISEVVSLMSLRAQAKGLRISVECAPDLPEVIESDERRLRQVLVNLLGNALKFTDSGGVVLRAARRAAESGAMLRFEIEDTGIGISPEQLARLFQPFAQADASTARRYGGTGLGLSICKRLVELLDGRLGVDSEVGAGSLFWVELPLREGAEKDDG